MNSRLNGKELSKLIVSGEAPQRVEASILDLSELQDPSLLPTEIDCHTLIWKNSPLAELASTFRVRHKLDLSGSKQLERLPEGLNVPVLNLTDCSSLQALPLGFRSDFLMIDRCTQLRNWPNSGCVTIGSVSARGCTALTQLPSTLGPLTTLDLRDCAQIDHVPKGVEIRAWIDVGGTRIQSLPESLSGTGIRWRGVTINRQIAFFPETLTASDALAQKNAEVRRVMVERIGFERFLKESNAKILHEDSDAGGARQLLQVTFEGDEPLVCVSVRCPSTGRHYLIRVPPTTTTCHQAIAWTAGFDDPDDYMPLLET